MISESSIAALRRAGTPREAVRRAPKVGGIALLVCAATVLIAGCSNEPLQPQGALWTGSSKARAGTASPGAIASSASLTSSLGASNTGGWGPYSGQRGQTTPPPNQTYAFKGDPNANGTFAPGPGQVQ